VLRFLALIEATPESKLQNQPQNADRESGPRVKTERGAA
jgi:hypothetical protein